MSISRRLRLILLIGSVALAMAAPSTVAAGGRFDDDDSSRYEAAIETVVAAGIMKPCDPPANDRFCPNREVTRGEMAVFLARTFDLNATSGVRFRDVDANVDRDRQGRDGRDRRRRASRSGSVPTPRSRAVAWPPT